MISIYTDGACKGNGKDNNSVGGFGVFVVYPDGKTNSIWGGESATTNNRMELLGAIVALQNTPANEPIQLFTDSNYVKDGITKWLTNWQKNGWKTANKSPVKNQDLWQQLYDLTQNRTIDWQWIKGHNGHFGNEKADELANLGTQSQGNEWQLPTKSHQIKEVFDEMDTINAQLAYESEQPVDNPKPKTKKTSPQIVTPIALDYNEEQNPEYNGDTSGFNPHFRAILPIAKHRGYPERQLIMDTETTGFEETKGDRIVEVGMIEMVGRKFTGQKLHIYINPEREMDEEVISVHGISNEFLLDKPTFAQVASYIYEFAQGAELIAHNASFDMRFLDMEFERAGFGKLSDQVKVTDSLAMARQRYKGQKNTLDALVQRLNVGKKDRTFHGALLDSEILAEVYLAMTSGQVALMIDETDDTDTSDFTHESLQSLSSLLACSVNDTAGDMAWRSKVL